MCHLCLALCCIFQYEKPLVLVQVRWSALVLYWEGFEALIHLFVLGSLLLGLLLLLLRVGKVGGNSCCRGTVVGCCPHGWLEDLHGVAPLADRAAHGIQRRALAGERVRDGGRVLPGRLWRPGFGFIILRKQSWFWFGGVVVGCLAFCLNTKHFFLETTFNTPPYPFLKTFSED